MLSLPSLAEFDRHSSLRIWLAAQPADMRCGFDRLAQLAQCVTGQDPLSGHLFLFRSRGGDRIKALLFEGDGYAVWYKNLETEDTHRVGSTEAERRANNQHVGLAEAGRMVGVWRRSGTWRSVMPQHGGASVPPRARWPRKSYHSTDSGGN
jgi:transposase